jgi:hypothetical protein
MDDAQILLSYLVTLAFVGNTNIGRARKLYFFLSAAQVLNGENTYV